MLPKHITERPERKRKRARERERERERERQRERETARWKQYLYIYMHMWGSLPTNTKHAMMMQIRRPHSRSIVLYCSSSEGSGEIR